jgi:hypothetical protein
MKKEHTSKALKNMRRTTCYRSARGLCNTLANLLSISSVVLGLYQSSENNSLWPLLLGVFFCLFFIALNLVIDAIFDLADAAILSRMDRARDGLAQLQANQARQ